MLKLRWRNRPSGKANQMDLSNRPAVLFLNGDGVEQSGKRDDERSISGVCTGVE